MGKGKREVSQERKAAAEQIRKEQARRAAQRKMYSVIGIIVLAVVVGGAALILGNQGSKKKSVHYAEGQVSKMLSGIAQQNRTLGDTGAKITIHEFADLQCPACKNFSTNELPKVIEKLVRPGKASIVYETYPIIGADSEYAARATLAAAEQNRAWYFVEQFYAQQEAEGSGYVTEDFVTKMARDGGLDVDRFTRDLKKNESKYTSMVDRTVRLAEAEGFSSTPSFEVDGPKGTKVVQQPTYDDIVKAITEAGGTV